MPVDWQINNDLEVLRRPGDHPEGWVRSWTRIWDSVLERMGTAAARDAGAGGGQIPPIKANGLNDDAPDATASILGLVTLTQSTTASDAETAIRAVLDVIGGGAIRITEPGHRFIRPLVNTRGEDGIYRTTRALTRLVTSNDASLLILATRGQDAPVDDTGSAGGEATVLLSDANVNENTTRIHINQGGASRVVSPTGETQVELPPLADRAYPASGAQVDNESEGMESLTDAQLRAFGFTWGFIFKGWGARGGTRGLGPTNMGVPVSPRSRDFHFTNRMRVNGMPGDMLIAYKQGISPIYYAQRGSFLFPHTTGGLNTRGVGGYALEILL